MNENEPLLSMADLSNENERLRARIAALEEREAEMRTLASIHSESADKAHARIAALEALLREWKERKWERSLERVLAEGLSWTPLQYLQHRTERALRGEGEK